MNNLTSHSQSIFKGALWSLLMRFSVRGIGILSLLVLARIFTPEDFGIVAKAVLFKEVLELLTQLGLESAIIRNTKATARHYNTAWSLSVLRGGLIALILIALNENIADFFNEKVLAELILIYALAMFIKGFTNIGIVDLRKLMRFDLDFRYNLVIKFSEFIPTLVIAVYYESIWAFPIGVICGSVVGVAFSYYISAYRPKFTFSELSELLHFGKWMLLHEISAAFSSKFDTFLLSKYSSNNTLGSYTIAYELSTLPINEIALPVGRATLPGLSKVLEKANEFKRINTLSIVYTLAIAIPASLGISALSDEIVALMLGDKWGEAGSLIEKLSLIGPATVVSVLSISTIVVKNKIKQLAVFSLVNLLFRSGVIASGYYFFGIDGLCISVLVTGYIRAIGFFLLQWKYNYLDFKVFANQVIRVLISAFVMYSCVWFFKEIVIFSSLLVNIIIIVSSGVIIFLINSIVLWKLLGCPDGFENLICLKLNSLLAK